MTKKMKTIEQQALSYCATHGGGMSAMAAYDGYKAGAEQQRQMDSLWRHIQTHMPPAGVWVLVRRDCPETQPRRYDTYLRPADRADQQVVDYFRLREFVEWQTIRG